MRRIIAFLVGIMIGMFVLACQKDDIQPRIANEKPLSTISVGDIQRYSPDYYYFVTEDFWFDGTHYNTTFPMGMSFAMYYNDSVTDSNVELVAWSGEYYSINKDSIILKADSFCFSTNTEYELEVDYAILSGSTDVDTLFNTWTFNSKDSLSTVLITELRLR